VDSTPDFCRRALWSLSVGWHLAFVRHILVAGSASPASSAVVGVAPSAGFDISSTLNRAGSSPGTAPRHGRAVQV
jgi:hypothetical protein